MLSSIVKKTEALPPRILIYGKEKIGKTTTACGFPNPIVIPAEDGVLYPNIDCFPVLKKFDELDNYFRLLATEQHSYQTLIIDTVDWLEQLIHAKIINAPGEKGTTILKCSGGYGNGYMVAANIFKKDVIEKLNYLRVHKKMTIVLICHYKVMKTNDPANDNLEFFDAYSPALYSNNKNNKGAGDILTEWVDIIGFASERRYFMSNENGISRITNTGDRVLYLEGRSGFIAGNRFGMPKEIPLGFEPLKAELNKFYSATYGITPYA